MDKLHNKDGTYKVYALKAGYYEVYSDTEVIGMRLSLVFKQRRFFVEGFLNKNFISKVFDKVEDARRYIRQYKKLKRIP
jgi:hypothetical protein